ncbi:MAG: inositol monophosphatase [Oligoflexia bacterium]|nr:inositol monophosphatase [Oligoflexia bacterium]
MSLNDEQLKELSYLANLAATKAGMHIASKQGSNVEVNSKEGGENIASCVVAEIDLEAEKIILEILQPTIEKYNLGLLAEETASENSSRLEKDYFWCIDPLDGTLAFSRNEDGYSTSIALVAKNGEPIIGAVYNPRTQTLYHALSGNGAYKNDEKLLVSKYNKKLTLLFDQSYLKYPDYDSQIEELKIALTEMGFESLHIHPLGGAVMNGISTIEMAPALYFKFPKVAKGGGSIWDFAASSLIQKEAGGFNSDYHQQPIDLNRSDCTFMNHKGIIFASKPDLLPLIPKL